MGAYGPARLHEFILGGASIESSLWRFLVDAIDLRKRLGQRVADELADRAAVGLEQQRFGSPARPRRQCRREGSRAFSQSAMGGSRAQFLDVTLPPQHED